MADEATMADEEDIDIDGDDDEQHTPLSSTEPSANAADDTRSRTASQRDTPAPSEGFDDGHLGNVEDAYSIPDWLSQTEQSIDTTGMDDQSRALIEQMLAEEEYYLGGRSTSFGGFEAAPASLPKGGKKAKEPASKRRKGHTDDDDTASAKSGGGGKGRRRSQSESASEKTKLSSADLPSHNTRWTSEEDDRLREGLKRHGYGNWKTIAGIVRTRNPLQCKNHARHLLVSDKIDDDIVPDPTTPASPRRSSSHDSSNDVKQRRLGTPSSSSSSSRLKRKRGASESGEDDPRGRSVTPASTGEEREIDELSESPAPFTAERDSDDSDVSIDIDVDGDDDTRPALEIAPANELLSGGAVLRPEVHGSTSPEPFNGKVRRGKEEEDEEKEIIEAEVGREAAEAEEESVKRRGRTVSFGGVRTKFIDDEEEGGRPGVKIKDTGDELEGGLAAESHAEREVGETSPPKTGDTRIGDDEPRAVGLAGAVDDGREGGGRASVEQVTIRREGGIMTRVNGATEMVVGERDNADTDAESRGAEEEEDEEADDDDSNTGLGPWRPMQEKLLDQTTVTAEERRENAEWFVGKHPKTPERYVKIRNHILSAWARCRPRYLTKTSIRSGLKDCGDVNAIGRVHTYLERVGAINVGCATSAPKPKRPAVRRRADERSEEEEGEESEALALAWVAEYEGPRRRRVRNEYGEWVDPKELEGRVISHENSTSLGGDDEPEGMTKEELQELYEQERLAAQNARYFAPGEIRVNTKIPKHKRAQFYLKQQQATSSQGLDHHHYHSGADSGYDPFLLIPLHHYTLKEPAPFKVMVLSDVVLVMDFHAHLAHTEIIGLLGGVYDPDRCTLRIVAAHPCRSLSTGIQCEMDPASELRAREVFAGRGLIVVGWYHSHPTFEPNPSVRDIENQAAYQTLFRRDTGVEPFIGAIISPYDPRHPSNQSRMQYLSISERLDETSGYRIPYACERDITHSDRIPPELFRQISELVREYRGYEHRVDLAEPYRRGEPLTRLDKLLDSIATSLYIPEDEATVFLGKVRELLEVWFVGISSVSVSVEADVERKEEGTTAGGNGRGGEGVTTAVVRETAMRIEGARPEIVEGARGEEVVEGDGREARRRIGTVGEGLKTLQEWGLEVVRDGSSPDINALTNLNALETSFYDTQPRNHQHLPPIFE